MASYKQHFHPSFSSIFLPFLPSLISTPKDGDCTSWDYQSVIQFLMMCFRGFLRHTALVIKRWFHSGNSGSTRILKGVRMGGSIWHLPTPAAPPCLLHQRSSDSEPGKLKPRRVNDNKRKDNGFLLGKKRTTEADSTCLSCILAELQTTNSDTSKDPWLVPQPLPRGSFRENIITHLLIFSCTFEVKVWSG